MALLILLGLPTLYISWVLGQPYFIERRRDKLRNRPIPAAWRDILKRRMPYFRLLPADLQLQLKKHIQVFIDEKDYIGCDGLVITDEMRVTIAAQACLLILNRKTDYYPKLQRILVYPGGFIVENTHIDEAGIFPGGHRVLAGESWAHGQVILSWQDTVEDADIVDDGKNVVIHEFAHQLDQENGDANGAPILERSEHYRCWSQVFGREFAKLQEQASMQQSSLFSYYGATNPAEFFAVVSEVFFEQPQKMADQYPALYQQLSGFYRLNPLSW